MGHHSSLHIPNTCLSSHPPPTPDHHNVFHDHRPSPRRLHRGSQHGSLPPSICWTSAAPMEVPRAGTSVPRTTIVRFDINKLGGGFEQAGLGGGLGLGGGFDSGLGGTDGLFGPGFGDSAGSNNIMTNDQGLNQGLLF